MLPKNFQNKKEIFPSYIKYQFLVVLGSSILILLFVAFFVTKLNRQTAGEIIAKYQNELLFSVKTRSSMMADKIENMKNEMIVLNEPTHGKRNEIKQIKKLFSNFFNRHKAFVHAIYYTDKNETMQLLHGKTESDQLFEPGYQKNHKQLLSEKKPVIVNLFIKSKNRYLISIHSPISNNNKIQGHISAFIFWDAFIAWFEKNKNNPDAFLTISDLEGNIIYHPNPDYIGNDDKKQPQILLNNKPASAKNLFENKTGVVSGHFLQNKKFIMACSPLKIGKTDYILTSYTPYSDIGGFVEKYSSNIILIGLASFFVIVLSLLVIVFLFYSEKNRLVHLHDELEAENAERKRSEDALRESEERFRGLAELLPITIFEMDPSGKLTFINRNGYNKFELTEEDLKLGVNIFDIISIEKRKNEGSNLENILGKGIYGPSEYIATSKEGRTFPVLFNSNIIWQKDLPVGFRGFIIDISDQVKAKDALQKREKMYHDIFNSVPIGLYIHDLDGYFLETNLNLIETLGYKEEDFINLNIKDIISEKYRHQFSNYMTRIIGKGYDQGPISITSANGKEHIFEYTNTLIENPSGLKTVHGTAREITDKIAADRALKESEEKYRDVVELSNDGIAIIQNGVVQFLNKYLSDIVGYSVTEIQGTPFTNYFPPDELTKVTDRYQKRMAGEDVESMYESKLIHKDGTIIPIEVNVGIISYKDSPAELAFIRDTTERKKIEEALRQSEEKHRTIIENIKEGYFETDLRGRITFANDSLCNIIGYSRDEIIGMKYYEDILKKHNPETAQQIYETFNAVFTTGEATFIENHEMVRKDGSIFIPEMSVSLIRGKDLTPLGFRSIVRDVTERHKAEQEKLRIENRLQQAQKMESIGTLAGGVAHDFNNLLMSMQGNVSLLLYKMGSDNPYYEKLKSIEQHIQDGSDLTKQLLGFARGGKYEVIATDLNEIIQKTSHMFARTNKEIRLHDKFQNNIWTVETDQGQISQVLLNLYVNAWQAMPGGGDLYISTQNVELDEKTTKPHGIEPGKFVKISVTDTGTGMDEPTLKRIFEPFFTTKEMGRGTGLGLASAYGIIRNHAGIIDVYSEKNKGTTFNIFLPASDKALIKQEAPKTDIIKGTETILFVDDEARIIDSAQEMLEALGYTVILAKSGDEALYRFKENIDKIDIVILDMVMSGMGGGEVFDHLKKINPDIKVLLSSGYSINGHAAEIMKRGCNGFIQKPFTLEQISKKIREIIDTDVLNAKNKNN